MRMGWGAGQAGRQAGPTDFALSHTAAIAERSGSHSDKKHELVFVTPKRVSGYDPVFYYRFVG